MKDLALSTPTYGQINPPPGAAAGSESMLRLINVFLPNFLVAIAVLATIFFIIYAGILWTTSGGDKQKVEQARQTLVFAIIGIIIVMLSFVIIRIIGQILGSQFLGTEFGGR
jgi:uncharacterized membrane protein